MADGVAHRITRQRQVILEELRKLHCHPTASELYQIVRKKLPRISLGTVYRNLDLLARDGIIQKLKLCEPEARFDGNPGTHYHIRCTECCHVDDLDLLPDDLAKLNPKTVNGYEILGYHIEFFGICPQCRQKKSGNK